MGSAHQASAVFVPAGISVNPPSWICTGALAASSSWVVEVGEARMPLVGTYADVGVGELLAVVGSAGTVEVSMRDGDAAARLGVGAGAEIILRPGA